VETQLRVAGYAQRAVCRPDRKFAGCRFRQCLEFLGRTGMESQDAAAVRCVATAIEEIRTFDVSSARFARDMLLAENGSCDISDVSSRGIYGETSASTTIQLIARV